MHEHTIGQVAAQAGIRSSTIRYSESIGLLPKAQRVAGKRRYSKDTIRLLSFIKLAQYTGFSVAEIQILLHGFDPATPPSERWKSMATKKLHELDELIVHIQNMRTILHKGLQCRRLTLDECTMIDKCNGADDQTE